MRVEKEDRTISLIWSRVWLNLTWSYRHWGLGISLYQCLYAKHEYGVEVAIGPFIVMLDFDIGGEENYLNNR